MNNELYLNEVDRLLKLPEDHNELPSKEFVEEFMARMPDEKDIPEEYIGRDAEDYYAWGVALGIDEQAEDEFYQCRIQEAMKLYNL